MNMAGPHTTLEPSPDGNPPRPRVALLSLALPTVAQMASYTVMQFADTIMLSRVSDVAATAVGQAGMIVFSFMGFGIGVLLVVNTLVSQRYGARDYSMCGKYMWQGIWFGLIYGLLLLPMLPVAYYVFKAAGHEPALRGLETTYFHIALAAASIKFISLAMAEFLIATNRPRAPLMAAVMSMIVNIPAAYILIFGHLGLPAMGVRGAAWGTNFALLVEMLTLAYFVFFRTDRLRYGLHLWRPARTLMMRLLRVGIPSGVQVVTDIAAWTAFMVVVIAEFGTEAMAANTFAFRYMSVSFMPAVGISAGVTALVGRYIGMGKPDISQKRANLGFMVTLGYMATCAVGLFVGRHWLIGLFSSDPEIIRIGAIVLTVMAIYQLFDAVYVIYIGALRGAGDTFVPAVFTATMCWSITVLGGWLVGHYFPQFGVAGPWTMAAIYGAILGIFIFVRFQRGGWKKLDLEADSTSDKLRGFDPVMDPATIPS
jgi:MATE family multidrug resistance protein